MQYITSKNAEVGDCIYIYTSQHRNKAYKAYTLLYKLRTTK